MKIKFFSVGMLSIVIFSSIGFSVIAHADDNNGDDEYEAIIQPVSQSEPVVQDAAKTAKPQTVTQTVTDPPTTVIVNEVRNVTMTDSDADGLIDSEDPHPNIAEIYFVKDDNFNGIVDTFENYISK